MRSSGFDSPVSRASSTRLLPASTAPSAGFPSPGNTRIRSPGCCRRTGTRSNRPAASFRSTLCGRRRISASSAPAVRSRNRSSSSRPDSRKKTNIVTESYQTSPPPPKVAAVLAPKATSTPSATGTSMPIRPLRTSRQAAEKNGRQENSTTGSVSTHEAHPSSATASAAISPGAAM